MISRKENPLKLQVRALRVLRDHIAAELAERWVAVKWRSFRRNTSSREAKADIVISLTSYPPRFAKLHLTLKCLLMQNAGRFPLVLWIGYSDMDKLPSSTLELTDHGLMIVPCEDVRSYTKIVHALRAYPEAAIAIADDDTFYWSTWLSELLAGRDDAKKYVPCHRAHRIRLTADGDPATYASWQYETTLARSGEDIFGTGVGGVLYPPGSLGPTTTNAHLYKRLAPSADDIWLYWMIRSQGWVFRRVPGRRLWINWNSSQAVSLNSTNVHDGGNDRQIRNMISEFGWPKHDAAPSNLGASPAAAAPGQEQ